VGRIGMDGVRGLATGGSVYWSTMYPARKLYFRPVLPNPPSARALASKLSTTRKRACATGTITRREPVERVQHERFVSAIPAAHHQRALVVGVDQSRQVAEHDAVLVAEPRARQDHLGVAGFVDVDGDAGGDEVRVAGRRG
jgi:hypothetical protein